MNTSEVPADSLAPAAVAPVRRWRRRLLLVTLALALVACALLALAPTLASRFGRGPLERAFAERYHGRLEVEALNLAWGGRQSIEHAQLFDPAGGLVASVDVELPGLWPLLVGRGKRLGSVRVVLNADLVVDDEGVSNLDRALAPRGGAAPAPTGGSDESQPAPEPPDDDAGLALSELAIDLDLRLEHLSYEDALTRGAGTPFVLDDFTAQLALDPGGSVNARAAGLLASGSSGVVQLSAQAENLFEPASSARPPSVDLDLQLSDLPVALIDQLAAQGGLLTELLGERVTLIVRGAGTPLSGQASVSLTSERAQLSARGEIEGGVLRSRDGFALEADLAVPRALVGERLAPLLPAEFVLSPATDELRLRATISRLALPVAAILDARAAGADVLVSLVESAELALDLELGDWWIGAPDAGEPVRVNALAAGARLAGLSERTQADVELHATLDGAEGGLLSARLATVDLAELVACARGAGSARAEAGFELRAAPSALLAPWTAAAGLDVVFGPQFDLEAGFDGEFALGGPASGRLRLDLATRGERLTARLDALLPEGQAPGGVPALELRGELGGLAFARPLVPEELAALFDELLGDSLALDLRSVAGEAGSTQVDLKTTTARTRVELSCTVQPDAVTTRGEQRLSLSARPSQALLDLYLAARLPEGTSLRLRSEEESLELSVSGLDWPTSTPDGEAEAPAALLGRASAELELGLPGFLWSQPPAAGPGDAVVMEFDGLRALASLAPESGLALNISAQLAESAEAALEARASVPHPEQFLAEPPVPLEMTLALRGRALPTSLVDALALQEGLLVDVLGETLDLELDARLPARKGELKLALRSPKARVDLTGGLRKGSLVAQDVQGIEASMPLSPLFNKRIVGALLPMAVGLSKPADAPPAELSVSNFVLPLDGNLRRLNADVHLELNQVSYRVLPGFSELVASVAGESATTSRVLNLRPLDLAIRDGVIEYASLPLEIGGEPVEFSGSFDLVTREMDLTTELKLSVLGSKVGRELAKAREYIDPNTSVPLRISGRPRRPRISVGRDFVEDVLEQAATNALEKGLGDLLDRALKKDG